MLQPILSLQWLLQSHVLNSKSAIFGSAIFGVLKKLKKKQNVDLSDQNQVLDINNSKTNFFSSYN